MESPLISPKGSEDLWEDYNFFTPLQSSDDAQQETGSTKESLLTTKIMTCTREIFEQAQQVQQLSTKWQENSGSQDLYEASKKFCCAINILLKAKASLFFQMKEERSSQKKKVKKNVKELISTNCLKMMKLCLASEQKSLKVDESPNKMKTDWSQVDLQLLKGNFRDFIQQANSLFANSSYPTIVLSEESTVEKLAHKFKRPSELNCHFDFDGLQKQWNKVKDEVEEYFKTHFLIDLSQREFQRDQLKVLLFIEQLKEPLSNGLYLKEQKKLVDDEKKIKKLEKSLRRNVIHVLGAYQRRLVQLALALRDTDAKSASNSSDWQHLGNIKQIFKDCLKKEYSDELASAFFKAISDSLTTHYIENKLEKHIVGRMKEMLAEWSQKLERKKSIQPLSYAKLLETHWERLLNLTTLNHEEMERALLGEYIQIVNEKGEILLPPPQKKEEIESREGQLKRINGYLPLTEEFISKHIGDPTGTLLTNFREIGWKILKQSQKDPTELAKLEKCEESVLSMDQQIFKVFAPVMKQIESGQSLSLEQEALLKIVEDSLKKTNPEMIKKHGLKEIAIFLFRLHRILNQSFMIGTMTVLKSVLLHFHPDSKKDITYLDAENSKLLNVVLGQNGRMAIEWQLTYQLYSKTWPFIHLLHIDLPVIGSKELKGKVRQEFTFKPIVQKEEIELEEKDKVEELLFNIRHALKSMEFPDGTFNKVIEKKVIK